MDWGLYSELIVLGWACKWFVPGSGVGMEDEAPVGARGISEHKFEVGDAVL